MRRLLLFVFGAWCSAASIGFAQDPNNVVAEQKKKDEAVIEKRKKLDQLIAEALKNSPDLRVAEAKVRLAEAEFYRTRVRITTELQAANAEIEAAEAGAEEGLIRFNTAERLFKVGNISREDYGAALLSYLKLKSEAANARAKLPLLLGRLVDVPQRPVDKQADEPPEVNFHWENPMAKKLHEAMIAPIKPRADEMNQLAIMDYLRTHLKGVALQVRHKTPKDRVVAVPFKEPIPLRAFVQFVEDEFQCIFILRDYGIVVVPADERLPPGAIRLIHFTAESPGA